MGTYYFVLTALYTLMKTMLWERRSEDRLPTRVRKLSLLQTLRTDYGAQTATYLMGTAKIILLPKPGKNLTDMSSYRPISLLSEISKVLEKLILKEDQHRYEPTFLDPAAPIWLSSGTLHNSTMSSYRRYYKQSFGISPILHGGIPRCQLGFRQSLA